MDLRDEDYRPKKYVLCERNMNQKFATKVGLIRRKENLGVNSKPSEWIFAKRGIFF
jgi:hypothetical protein